MEERFKLLTKPLRVGSMELKHRMIMGPMWTRMATVNGEVSQQMINHYAARSRGGAALVIIEATMVDGRYGWPTPTLCIDNIRYMPGLSRLVEAIHRNGAAVLIELVNVGAHSTDPISPSEVPVMLHGAIGVVHPRAMTLEEIEDAREKFITAAVRAKEIEFDGVLIHGATAYLLHQFRSPFFNKRTDRYGGSLENRMRLSLEIVRGIRQKCGPEFVLGYDFVADDFMPGGVTMEESLSFARALEQAGVDYIDLMVGTYETMAVDERCAGTLKYGPKGMWEYTAQVKKVVSVPVFHRAMMDYDPDSWEKHIEEKHADVIQLAKASLCDPEVFNKVLDGRLDDIRPCTCCVHCTDRGVIRQFQVSCAMNPELGREKEYAIQRTSEPKKVLVVGGGPGGLEAARVAALQGHEVTLVEKEKELGGTIGIMSLCIGNEIHRDFRDWLVRECTKAGVKFELNKEATLSLVQGVSPDVVILATGAPVPIVPELPGISKACVVGVKDVLMGNIKLGETVVVLGGNRIGADTAYTIANRKWARKVTVIEPRDVPSIAYDMEVMNRARLVITLMPKHGIQALTKTQIEEITEKDVIVRLPEGKKQKIEADSVILAMGFIPNNELYEALKGKVSKLYRIGDCVKARAVVDAVHEAACIARQI
jgi:2,4-dienoyl-CoA reductase-like NADH-dependent reductase (Old Yellow Enzyme family)/NADPH-dependent 2,4-dienoyl-CoA reductase/sulfur reductase-like enzyme